MKIDLIVGCRPNLVKAAALLHAAKDYPQLEFTLVHTGQHVGAMSDPFFKDLQLPTPAFPCDELTGNTAVYRLAQMIKGLSRRWSGIVCTNKPDAVMVVGDTDSTLAGAITAAKSGIPVFHVEAGLRNGDMKMQEELNRILVDSISSKHYTTSWFADMAMIREGKSYLHVGNVMVDTLMRFLPEAKEKYSRAGSYAIFTMHRAENVDDPEKAIKTIVAVDLLSSEIDIVWPRHPRIKTSAGSFKVVPPMSYLPFIGLLAGAKLVITDSGGIQEETSVLGIPCMTLRDSTERPETISYGTNRLVKFEDIFSTGIKLLKNPPEVSSAAVYMSGSASHRIMDDICATL